MAASKWDLARWFDDGNGYDRMIVVCDDYDFEDYPVYTMDADFAERFKHYSTSPMQRIMEVYDLNADRDSQLHEHRAMHKPAPSEGALF